MSPSTAWRDGAAFKRFLFGIDTECRLGQGRNEHQREASQKRIDVPSTTPMPKPRCHPMLTGSSF
jgi:hypothetical protein